ncbi:tryptophan synthase beta subunit-like PLP-dependent enzyme, partial [Lichtheimia hyalospora FSU 10163]
MTNISIEDIQAAAARIKVHRTPVITCSTLDKMVSEATDNSVQLLFKCEALQKTGSFKIRGASNAVQLLSDTDAACGVVTHSSGNHAQALAYAARQRGIGAHVVMPRNAPVTKKAAVRSYGANVIECDPTQADRERVANEVMRETGATFIHPYNNPHVIAGQGTIALETIAQVGELVQGASLDAMLIPVGGGGMLSGCAVAAKALSPGTRIYGAEPKAVDDCQRSYKEKKRLANKPGTQSVADALLADLGEIPFAIMSEYVDGIFSVSEEEIVRAMGLVWTRMKICIEPSAAVALAVALYNPEFHQIIRQNNLQRIAIILCGANVDVARAALLLSNDK